MRFLTVLKGKMNSLNIFAPVTVLLVWIYMQVLVRVGGIWAWPASPLGTETEAFSPRGSMGTSYRGI